MSFIVMISTKWSIKKSAIIYFVVQSIGSLTALSGVLFADFTYPLKCITVGLLLKASIAPLHFWGAPFITFLNNANAFLFLTWQKIGPLFLMFTTTPKVWIVPLVFLNALISAFCRLGSKRLYVLLFFSGLMHMRWILSTPIRVAAVYYVFYICIIAPIFIGDNSNLPLLMMNLAGLPPLTGFLIKLSALQSLRVTLGVLLLAFSAQFLYSYSRVYIMNKFVRGQVRVTTLLACSLGIFFV